MQVDPIRSKKDLEKIADILKNQNFRDYVFFKTGINFGLRISDILALNVGDVKDKQQITLIEKKTKKKKTIPVNIIMLRLFKQITKNRLLNEPLFINNMGQRLSRISAYRILKSACEEAQINGNFGTHTLRKTFGYHFYKQFNNIAMLQKILNHSHPAITLRYIGIEQDEINNSYHQFVL